MSITIVDADYDNPLHAQHIVEITNAYAQDEMGGSAPLPETVQREMVAGLRATPNAISLLAYEGETPLGVANCFIGYATFKARPLINVHDLAVMPQARGRGVGKALLDAVAARAQRMGACRVTLEVLENNPARRLYEREGFAYGEPRYLFMTRSVD